MYFRFLRWRKVSCQGTGLCFKAGPCPVSLFSRNGGLSCPMIEYGALSCFFILSLSLSFFVDIHVVVYNMEVSKNVDTPKSSIL